MTSDRAMASHVLKADEVALTRFARKPLIG